MYVRQVISIINHVCEGCISFIDAALTVLGSMIDDEEEYEDEQEAK